LRRHLRVEAKEGASAQGTAPAGVSVSVCVSH